MDSLARLAGCQPRFDPLDATIIHVGAALGDGSPGLDPCSSQALIRPGRR